MSYYYVDEMSQQKGPVSESELQGLIQTGVVKAHTLCWKEGLSEWIPCSSALPGFFAPPPAAPSGMSPQGGSISFDVIKKEFYQMPKITIQQQEVVIEAGQMHYMQGAIEIQANIPSVGKMLKAKLTKEKMVRPRYRGTGVIFLEPSFGECNILDLKGEEWILDKGCFLACEPQITIEMRSNKMLSGFFGGEGFFQTSVSGYGKVLFSSQGPLETVHLNQDVLTVDGSFAVARTAGLEFTPEKATKKMFSSWISGEGIVNRFRGTGTVLLAPFPNRFLSLMREFGGLHWALQRIGNRGS